MNNMSTNMPALESKIPETANQTTSSVTWKKDDDNNESRSDTSGVKRKRREAFESAVKKIKRMTGDGVVEEPSASQTQDDVEEGPISKLNSDCLAHIFSFFSPKELISIERVCKRWRELSQGCWTKERSLVVRNFTSIMTVDQFTQLLLRCGKHITCLDMSGQVYPLNSEKKFQLIGELCKNLKHLNIGGYIVAKRFRMKFLKAASNLESLDMSYCSGLKDGTLSPLLKAAKNLQKCVFSHTGIKGRSLINLSKSCKYLDLSQCSSLLSEALMKALEALPNLEVLKLDNSRIELLLEALKLCSGNLQELYVSGEGSYLDEADWPMFPSLRILSFNSIYDVTDGTISHIVEHCPNLEDLDVSGNLTQQPPLWYSEFGPIIKDDGVKKLAKLRKLHSIKINGHSKVTDESLKYLAANLSSQLTVIECRRCISLTDEGPNQLIDLCPNLIKLDVTYCPKITRGLIRAAEASVKLRENKNPLFLHVSDLSDEEFVEDGRLFLKVCNTEKNSSLEGEDSNSSEGSGNEESGDHLFSSSSSCDDSDSYSDCVIL